MIRFVLLLLPALVLADAGLQLPETMSNVMLVVNVNDTLDSDDDGIPAWRELKAVVDSIGNVLGEACYTCSLETRSATNTQDYPDAILIDQLSGFLDTSSVWSNNTGIYSGIVAGDDYIFTKLATCRRAAIAATGVDPKYFCLGMSQRWIRRNTSGKYVYDPSNADAITASAYDSVISKSLCDAIEIYWNPAIDTVWNSGVKFNGYWGSRYIEAARGASQKGFTPGVYRQYKNNSGGEASDSTLQYVICTQIWGVSDNAICDMVRKAYRGRYDGWTAAGAPKHPAIVDGMAPDAGSVGVLKSPFYANNGGVNTGDYGYNSAFWDYTVAAFGDSLYYDLFEELIDTSNTPDDTFRVSVGGNPDTCTVFFGYNQAFTASDSVLFYFSAMSYHQGGTPTDLAYQINLPLANGALVCAPESWSAWTISDTTFRAGTADNQTLCIEWLDPNGLNATYAIGRTREVNSVTYTTVTYLPDAMRTPEVPFAVVTELATVNKAQTIGLGWPSFAWRQAEQAVGSSASFAGSCDEIFTYTATSPADADSYLVVLEYDNDSTSTIRTNITGAPTAVNYSIGTRWISKGLSGVTIVYKDAEGNLHPEPVFQP